MSLLRPRHAFLHRPSPPPLLKLASSEAPAPPLPWLLGRKCCRTQWPRILRGWVRALCVYATIGVLPARFLIPHRAGFVLSSPPCQFRAVCRRLTPLRAPLPPPGRGRVLPAAVCGDGGRGGRAPVPLPAGRACWQPPRRLPRRGVRCPPGAFRPSARRILSLPPPPRRFPHPLSVPRLPCSRCGHEPALSAFPPAVHSLEPHCRR